MPTCDYCDEDFRDNDKLLAHLNDDHDRDELSSIDRRKVENEYGSPDPDESRDYVAIGAISFIIIIVLAVVGFILASSGTGGSEASDVKKAPGPAGSAHYHGQMDVVVDGQEIEFSQSKYQVRDDRFHFEGGNGERWHSHATGVTLEYGLEALGFDVNKDLSLTVDGTTYTDVKYIVNGEPVNPQDYVLKEGDNVRVVAE